MPQAPHERPDPAQLPAAEATGGPTAATGLDERALALLEFERQWWKEPGSKDQAVRERFGVGPTRYYQLVNALLEREDALRHDPMLVKRLRRARDRRLQVRTARRIGRQG